MLLKPGEKYVDSNKTEIETPGLIQKLMDKYDYLCSLNIISLDEEKKLKTYIKKAYIENLLIGYNGENIGVGSYQSDVNIFMQTDIYDQMFFVTRYKLNQQLINILMKKLASLLGKEDDFILKISNFSEFELIIKAFYNNEDLLSAIDNIDNYFEQCSGDDIKRFGKIDFKCDTQYKKNLESKSLYPELKINSQNEKRKINDYLCKKLSFNGLPEEKYKILLKVICRTYFFLYKQIAGEEKFKKLIKNPLTLEKMQEKIINSSERIINLKTDSKTRIKIFSNYHGKRESTLDELTNILPVNRYINYGYDYGFINVDKDDFPQFMFKEEYETFSNQKAYTK